MARSFQSWTVGAACGDSTASTRALVGWADFTGAMPENFEPSVGTLDRVTAHRATSAEPQRVIIESKRGPDCGHILDLARQRGKLTAELELVLDANLGIFCQEIADAVTAKSKRQLQGLLGRGGLVTLFLGRSSDTDVELESVPPAHGPVVILEGDSDRFIEHVATIYFNADGSIRTIPHVSDNPLRPEQSDGQKNIGSAATMTAKINNTRYADTQVDLKPPGLPRETKKAVEPPALSFEYDPNFYYDVPYYSWAVPMYWDMGVPAEPFVQSHRLRRSAGQVQERNVFLQR